MNESQRRAPILFLHEVFHGGWSWLNVAPWLLASGHAVLVPDLPGRPVNIETEARITLQDQAAFIANRLSSENITKPIIVAKGAGGLVAALLVSQHTILPKQIFLIDCPMPRDEKPWCLAEAGGFYAPQEKNESKAMLSQQDSWVAPPSPIALGAPAQDFGLHAFMQARLRAQPISLFTTPVSLPLEWANLNGVKIEILQGLDPLKHAKKLAGTLLSLIDKQGSLQ